MRTLLFAALLHIVLDCANAQTIINNYNLTRDKHDVVINGSFGNTVLGMGVNLNSPLYPQKAIERLVTIPANKQAKVVESATKSPVKPESATLRVNTTSIVDTKELSRYLSTSLKGSYGVVSADMSYQRSRELTTEYYNKIVELIYTTTQPDISNYKISVAKPRINNSFDDEAKLRAFNNKYGSHFISDIQYGFRISIIGSLSKENSSDIATFKAAMSAAFSGGSAGGSISSTQQELLSSSKVNIKAEVTAGGLSTNQYILNSFEEIEEFIEKFKNNEIIIFPGPISFTASTYWTYLDKSEDLQALFNEAAVKKLATNNGVPVGTILPFKVPENYNGSIEAIIPDGWRIFNEAENRFLLGTTGLDSAGELGGQDTHNHTTNPLSRIRARKHSGGTNFAAWQSPSINATKTLPPYIKVIYIVKL